MGGVKRSFCFKSLLKREFIIFNLCFIENHIYCFRQLSSVILKLNFNSQNFLSKEQLQVHTATDLKWNYF